MCCIFTCCGWMVDLIQRLWTFTMSCVISSAVCCSLVISSMSGVALGYNYSLAEYIDLKETNVSVYLKRGVFDDEIADDIDWRRSGHQPVAGHIGEDNLMTGASDDSTTMRSGRRLDDSIYESNDRSNFEGSLMRLTAKPPDPGSTLMSSEKPVGEIVKQYEMGSLDQLKAIQSVINMKKAEAAARRPLKKIQETQDIVEKRPPFPVYGRRAMQYSIPDLENPSTYNSLRAAVPDDQINDPAKWILPKLPPQAIPQDVLYVDNYMSPTYPSPVTPRAGPARPTRPKVYTKFRTRPASTYTTPFIKPSRSPEINLPKSIDDDMEVFKKKLMEDKFVPPMIKDDDFLKNIDMGKIKSNEDYDDEIKGVPLRKKRNIDLSLIDLPLTDLPLIDLPLTDLPLEKSFDIENKTGIENSKDVVKTYTELSDANFKGQIAKTNADLKSSLDSGLQENKVAPSLTNLEMSPTNIIIKILSSALS